MGVGCSQKHVLMAQAAVIADGATAGYRGIGPCDSVLFCFRVSTQTTPGDTVVFTVEFQDEDDAQWYPIASTPAMDDTSLPLYTTALAVPPDRMIRISYDVTTYYAPVDSITFGCFVLETNGAHP